MIVIAFMFWCIYPTEAQSNEFIVGQFQLFYFSIWVDPIAGYEYLKIFLNIRIL